MSVGDGDLTPYLFNFTTTRMAIVVKSSKHSEVQERLELRCEAQGTETSLLDARCTFKKICIRILIHHYFQYMPMNR